MSDSACFAWVSRLTAKSTQPPEVNVQIQIRRSTYGGLKVAVCPSSPSCNQWQWYLVMGSGAGISAASRRPSSEIRIEYDEFLNSQKISMKATPHSKRKYSVHFPGIFEKVITRLAEDRCAENVLRLQHRAVIYLLLSDSISILDEILSTGCWPKKSVATLLLSLSHTSAAYSS